MQYSWAYLYLLYPFVHNFSEKKGEKIYLSPSNYSSMKKQ